VKPSCFFRYELRGNVTICQRLFAQPENADEAFRGF
jgi:hypothetical protein